MSDHIKKLDIEIFAGKTVSFGTVDDNLAVKEIEFREMLGRVYVVGRVPKATTNNDWAEGKECAVAWDSVTDYIIFDSEDDYARSIENS